MFNKHTHNKVNVTVVLSYIRPLPTLPTNEHMLTNAVNITVFEPHYGPIYLFLRIRSLSLSYLTYFQRSIVFARNLFRKKTGENEFRLS